MVIERTVETIENGINSIIKEIEILEELSGEIHLNYTSIGAVQGQLDALKKIDVLKAVLVYLGINSYEYKGNVVKII